MAMASLVKPTRSLKSYVSLDGDGIPRFTGTTFDDHTEAYEECRRRANGIS